MFMLNSTLSYVYKCRYLYEIFFSWLYIYTCKDVHDEKKSANSYSLFLPFRIPLVKWRPKLMTWAVRVSLTISEKGEKLCSCKQDLYSCTHPLCCVAQLAYNLEKSALFVEVALFFSKTRACRVQPPAIPTIVIAHFFLILEHCVLGERTAN